ncbi:hypothetical protein [Planomicrobium sp. CPCC 101079]|uniref:hypothetical protein n=1 Tax=Planomicrobium sp. CPCC 101079 TaxID=2599618 RepID=UPI0011B375F6|nr:hypothetical protein [Planomicrobium sp. CPCC 101079]TWT04611.1 hypothetical protein FQV28_08385 [Planomicrobium sp. CPCC 101079]
MDQIGGVLPDSFGLSLTVFATDATPENPIMPGDILVLANTGPYQARRAAAGEAVQLVSKDTARDVETPLGVHAAGFSRNVAVKYTGAIAVGNSVEADGAGGVRAAAAANGTYVVKVDTVRQKVEVLIP